MFTIDSFLGSVFYTGVLYYQQKPQELDRWVATLAVGKDAITLAQVILALYNTLS